MIAQSKWDAGNIPDQTGRVFVVTGSSSGIGKEAARVLAGENASVILAVRNVKKGQNTAAAIRNEYAAADVSVRELDLASLASVEVFAASMLEDYERLDILIDNAGVMMCPYSTTDDGFELQLGTNHLGHFALTGRLMPLLKKTPGSRIVVLSSIGHRGGKLDLSDLNWEKRKYDTSQAYYDSKLANLYFTYELAQKLEADGNNPMVTAAHPGWTATDLQRHSGVMAFLTRFLAQGVDMGALPTLRAAIAPDARPGDYFGPGKRFEMYGYPVKVESSARSRDRDAAQELWQQSERLTGVEY